jgi:4-carboxymuconolactone decarboxylase
VNAGAGGAGARYRELAPAELDEAQLAVFEAIGRPRGGAVPAPFHIYLENPEVASLVQQIGAFCRYRTGLTPRLSELAILVVASHWRADYEFGVHAREALKAGVPAGEIEALRDARPPSFDDPDAELVHAFASEFFRDNDVTDATFQRAAARFGRKTVVELVALMGYYSMLAIALRIFRVPGPDGG